MTRGRWFLPETPDVLGMLREQTAITVEGMEALIAWSVGEPGAADRLRDCEHRADDRKRELRAALTHLVHDAARARGHLRALDGARPCAEQREEHSS